MRCLFFLRAFASWFLLFRFSVSVAFSSGIIWSIVSAVLCIIADVDRIMSDWARTASGTAANLASISSFKRSKNLHFCGITVRSAKCGRMRSRTNTVLSKYGRISNGSSLSVCASDDGLWDVRGVKRPDVPARTSARRHSIPPFNWLVWYSRYSPSPAATSKKWSII
jgi:hypothetical protein